MLVGLIRVYRAAISPLLGERCRFYPSCSQYALESLHKYPLRKAIQRSAWRLLRCQPLSAGGVDLP